MLGEHDVDWAVLGGGAANVYRGAARMTFDVDLLVTVDHSSMAAIAESAEMEGWHIRYLHPDGRMVRLSHDEMAVEDVIVHKLVANRPRDVADIADRLEARAPLDVDYLEHWMQVWGVADRLAAICQRHALPPPERLAQEGRPPHLEATTADHRGTHVRSAPSRGRSVESATRRRARKPPRFLHTILAQNPQRLSGVRGSLHHHAAGRVRTGSIPA